MDLYKKEIRLLSTDVDVYRRLRLSALFTRMQEAAIEHTTALGAGREKTLDKGFLWIVTQQQVQIRRMPEFAKLAIAKSTIRVAPTKGTAGLH